MSFIKKFIKFCKNRNKTKIHPIPHECIICYENNHIDKTLCCKQTICKDCFIKATDRYKRCPHCNHSIHINDDNRNEPNESSSSKKTIIIRIIGFLIYCGLFVAIVAIIVV